MRKLFNAARSPYVVWASILVVVLYALFLVAHLVPGLRTVALQLSPWFYVLAGALVLYPSLRTSGKPFAIWAFAAFMVVFILSALGAANPKLFGAFRYGTSLGILLFDAPPVWAFNWVLILYAASRFVQSRLQGTSGVVGESIVAVCTGVVIMFYEWMIIPLAIRMQYWTFLEAELGFRHFFAWFLIGTVAAFTYLYYSKPRVQKQCHTEEAMIRERSASRLVGLYALCQLLVLLLARLVWAVLG